MNTIGTEKNRSLYRVRFQQKTIFRPFQSVHNQEVFTNRGFPVAHIFAILQRNSKSMRRYTPHSVRPCLNVRDGQNGPGAKHDWSRSCLLNVFQSH